MGKHRFIARIISQNSELILAIDFVLALENKLTIIGPTLYLTGNWRIYNETPKALPERSRADEPTRDETGFYFGADSNSFRVEALDAFIDALNGGIQWMSISLSSDPQVAIEFNKSSNQLIISFPGYSAHLDLDAETRACLRQLRSEIVTYMGLVWKAISDCEFCMLLHRSLRAKNKQTVRTRI